MNELIRLEQPPIIKENLSALGHHWSQMARDAENMVCNEETIQSVKAFRTEMRKEWGQAEILRKKVRNEISKPYEEFLKIYNFYIGIGFFQADKVLSNKIEEVENEIKRKCEESLREYFEELKVAHHVEWLKYEQAGIKVDLMSAKQVVPKKLREQLVCFVVRIASDVDTISTMEHAEEILAEYKPCLSLSQSISTFIERHRRIEEERVALDTRSTERSAENVAIGRIMALGVPVVISVSEVDENEVIPRCTFTAINATRAQLRRLKDFMEEEGIKYE